MTFRNDRERAAWEFTYDNAIRATVGDKDAILYADAKIEAMREREAKVEPEPTMRGKPEAPVRGERERLLNLADAICLHDGVSLSACGVVRDEIDKAIAALPPEPAPEPSQRGALERVRKAVTDRWASQPTGICYNTVLAIIDAEIEWEPPDDREQVERVLKAGRALRSSWSRSGLGPPEVVLEFLNALGDLDRVRGGGA